MPSALDAAAGGGRTKRLAASSIIKSISGRVPALFLDYDGTLTPIVERPELARLAPQTRELLRQLALHCPVAIISGRDLGDVRSLVRLDELYYAGSHGFEIAGPGAMHREQPDALSALPALDDAQRRLGVRLAPIAGARLERKRFGLAIHYRQVSRRDVNSVVQAVNEVAGRCCPLRLRGGKMVLELLPDIEWHKGKAVLTLLEHLSETNSALCPIYIGDDVTDEDAFAALSDSGVTIRVGDPDEPTQAGFHLADPGEVAQFLSTVLSAVSGRPSERG